VTDAQTFFDAVSYNLRARAKPHTIEANVQLPQRNPARHSWLVVRTPTHEIKQVTLNGKSWSRIDKKMEAIDLSGVNGTIGIEVAY
jgi:hypothetical protein